MRGVSVHAAVGRPVASPANVLGTNGRIVVAAVRRRLSLKARKRVYTFTPIRPRWRLRPKVVGGLIEPTDSRTELKQVACGCACLYMNSTICTSNPTGRLPGLHIVDGDLYRWRLPRQSGPGRVGRALSSGEHEREFKGADAATNNRMELTAANRRSLP